MSFLAVLVLYIYIRKYRLINNNNNISILIDQYRLLNLKTKDHQERSEKEIHHSGREKRKEKASNYSINHREIGNKV